VQAIVMMMLMLLLLLPMLLLLVVVGGGGGAGWSTRCFDICSGRCRCGGAAANTALPVIRQSVHEDCSQPASCHCLNQPLLHLS